MSEFWKTAPAAMVTLNERELLHQLAEQVCENYDQPVMVNLGVGWAGSMHCLRAGCERGILVGVDIDYDYKKIKEKELLNAIFIKGDSTQLWKEFKVIVTDEEHQILYETDRVDLLFIDGDHCYETVIKDIKGWTTKVPIGGVVAFHDYEYREQDVKWDECLPGVKKAVNEVFEHNIDWTEIARVDSMIAYKHEYRGD